MPFEPRRGFALDLTTRTRASLPREGQAHRSLEGGRMGRPRAALTTVEHFSFSFPGKSQEDSAQKHSNLSLL